MRVLDAAGRVLSGFDWGDGEPVSGDHLAAGLRWRGQPRLSKGEAIRLEFRAGEAHIFGFTFASRP